MRRLLPPLLLALGAGCATSEALRAARSRAAPGHRPADRAPGAVNSPLLPGLHPLGLSPGRDGLLYVPGGRHQGTGATAGLLHGAGSSAQNAWETVRHEAEDRGLAVLMPESRGLGLELPARRLRRGSSVHRRRAARSPSPAFRWIRRHVILAGFSAGGLMVLSLGPSNGDLFGWVLAFSPVGIDVRRPGGPSALFHRPRYGRPGGEHRACRAAPSSPPCGETGATVVYREFEGPHEVPDFLLQESLTLALER